MNVNTVKRYLSSNRRALGALGERMAAHLLTEAGYLVISPKRAHSGDLRAIVGANGFCVEVKTARKSCDGKWRFTLYKPGHTDFRDSDVVLLLAVLQSGRCIPFAIPVAEIESDRQQICITSHPERYAGRWAIYRQDGSIILQ